MALKLRVISDQYKALGKDSSRLFGVTGGRIGRANDNDWILPDPERYVSSHHAKVLFQGGQWILEDVSTNGVFINDGDTPLSVTGPRKLKDGDRLRFGDYDVLVSIDDRNDFSSDASGQMPRPNQPKGKHKNRPSNHHAAREIDDDLGEELDITGLFMARVSEEDVLAKFEDSPIHPHTAKASAPDIDVDDVATDQGDEPTLPPASDAWHMATRRLEARNATPVQSAPKAAATVPPPSENRAPAAKPQPSIKNAAGASSPLAKPTPQRTDANRRADGHGELQAGLEAFCRGAGIDGSSLGAEAQAALLTLAGQMVREVVLDLMESLKQRAEQKNRLHASHTTIQPNNNNPLKFSASVEEAMKKLFDPHSTRYVGPIEAVREAFEDVRNHQMAIDAAMQTAVEDLLHRLDPNELQERFDRGLKRSPLLSGGNKSKYWDLYTEFYPLINQRDGRGFPAVFAQEFARTYAEKLDQVENQRRK